jgi:hypothetical protein
MAWTWLSSWDEARRHKQRTRISLFVVLWVISIIAALVLLGSALGDVLVSAAFATVVALLSTLMFEPVLRQETGGRGRKPSGTSRVIGGLAAGLVFALGTRVVGDAASGLIGVGIVIVAVAAVMAAMVWVTDR